MTHAEIWDDSVLVESWNEALEEYKHYHSIHTRGENIEDAIHSHNNPSKLLEERNGRQDPAQDEPANKAAATNGMSDDPSLRAEASKPEKVQLEAESLNKLSAADQTTRLKRSESQSHSPTIPHHLIGSVHDEGLKSLLMSWYYAGYYTGLYEGQNRPT